MTPRELIANPLLLKELASQARRPGRPGWSYPGPAWFMVLTLVPAVLFLNASLRVRIEPETARAYFLYGALLQLWLLALRSTLYTATSMASEVRQGSLPVLLSTPLTLAGALAAKLAACLLPLWLEVLAALPWLLALYSWHGSVPLGLILAVTGYQLAVSFLCAGLGTWLGGILGDPEPAAASARTLTFVLLGATALSSRIVPGSVVVAGLALWACLVWVPRIRPKKAIQSSVVALLLLLFLPLLAGLGRDSSLQFDLTRLNPLWALYRLNSADPNSLPSWQVLEGDPDYEAAWFEATRDGTPKHLLAAFFIARDNPELCQRLQQGWLRANLQALLLLGLTQLGAGALLLHLAASRARNG